MHYGLNVATGIEEAITALRDRECRICLLTRVERKVVGEVRYLWRLGRIIEKKAWKCVSSLKVDFFLLFRDGGLYSTPEWWADAYGTFPSWILTASLSLAWRLKHRRGRTHCEPFQCDESHFSCSERENLLTMWCTNGKFQDSSHQAIVD